MPGVARQLTTQLGQRNTVSAYARYGFYYSTHSCCQSLRPDSLAPPNILLLRVIMTAMPVALLVGSRHHRFHGRRCHVHVHGHVRALFRRAGVHSGCYGSAKAVYPRQRRCTRRCFKRRLLVHAQITRTPSRLLDASLRSDRWATPPLSPPAALPDPSSPNYAAVYYGTYRTTTSS